MYTVLQLLNKILSFEDQKENEKKSVSTLAISLLDLHVFKQWSA